MRAQQHLIRVSLAALRPTQMTIGAAEVQAKRAQWGRLKRKEREGRNPATGETIATSRRA
ncbi:MAG: hypothetical protein LCH90_22165, partial [Proteobacteria bacterium]|nr:hypothetical protein [Pseudomonadota bacterium]